MMTEVIKIKKDNAHLAVERSGKGKAIVFLHAGVADKRMWSKQTTAFGGDHLVVAYDRRGFGKTTAIDESFSNVEDLREVLDHLGISTTSLVGCSQGGRIAIDFTLAYPQRVTALALIAPAISGAPGPQAWPFDIQAHLEELDSAEDANDLARVNEIEANLWLDGPSSPAGRVSGGIRKLFLDMNAVALNMPTLTREVQPLPAYPRLSDLLLPVLVLWGALDFPHVKDQCRYLVAHIPGATGKEIPGTAHLPNLEKPEQVNTILRKFLSQWFGSDLFNPA